jgi:ABC-type phosphate transport system permease subunit
VLALARVAGETAPLLFTRIRQPFSSTSLTQPVSSLRSRSSTTRSRRTKTGTVRHGLVRSCSSRSC